MRTSIRILVGLIVIGTICWVMTNGGGLMSKAVESTRKVVALWNLSSIKDALLLSRTLQEPDVVSAWSTEDFSEFLRDYLLIGRDSARDPAMDPWKEPYLLEPLGEGSDWVIICTGPNMEVDLCDFEGSGGDDLCLIIEAAEFSQ